MAKPPRGPIESSLDHETLAGSYRVPSSGIGFQERYPGPVTQWIAEIPSIERAGTFRIRRLKIWCSQGRGASIPHPGTILRAATLSGLRRRGGLLVRRSIQEPPLGQARKRPAHAERGVGDPGLDGRLQLQRDLDPEAPQG